MECATVRVRYAETDAMGIAYHANYLVWFEVGRNEWFRSSQLNYRDVETKGVMLPVIEASCHYRSPARYDDLIEVHSAVTVLTPARIEFGYRLFRKGDQTLLADGKTVHAFVNVAGRPVNLRKVNPELWRTMSALAGVNTAPVTE